MKYKLYEESFFYDIYFGITEKSLLHEFIEYKRKLRLDSNKIFYSQSKLAILAMFMVLTNNTETFEYGETSG